MKKSTTPPKTAPSFHPVEAIAERLERIYRVQPVLAVRILMTINDLLGMYELMAGRGAR